MERLSPTFCVLPWIHLFIDVEGKFYPCTMAHDSDVFQVVENGCAVTATEPRAIERAWNSLAMRDLRQQMLRGERPPICVRCFGIEDLGMTSYRQIMNTENRDQIDRVASGARADGTADMDFQFVDIRLGNLCNLRCRMCSPHSTRNLIDEFKELRPDVDWNAYGKVDWFEQQELWETLLEHFGNVTDLHFAGGEPLINKRKWKFLETLVSKGLSEKIAITYNTNLAYFPPQAKDLWPHFSTINLAVSVDGFGPVNSYIRYPSEWQKLVEHLGIIDRDHEKLNVGVCELHPVIQAYNILRLHELYDFARGFQFISHFPRADFVVEPACFDIQVLPPELKKLARERLERYSDFVAKVESPEFSEPFAGHIRGIIRHLDNGDRSHLIPEFVRWTKIYDRSRKQNLLDVVPELAPMLASAGSNT